MRSLSTFLSLFLTPLLVANGASVPGSTTPAQPNSLQIRLADPGKAIVEASTSVKGLSILVTDGSGSPVPDVAVAIRLPDEGATGFFQDGAHSAVAYTDATGVAKFAQVNWGPTLGTVQIRVTAAKGELHAGVLIEQTLIARTASAPTVQSPSLKIISPNSTSPNPTSTHPATPGTPVSVATVHSGATPEKVSAQTTETAASAEPAVSIVNSGSKGGSHNNKKWLVVALVAVGAGVGAAVALSAKGGPTGGAAAAGVSIGSPTISVGH